MAETSQTNSTRNKTIIPTPPRVTGDAETDSKASLDWIWQFFQAAVLQSGLLDPAFQSKTPDFDPASLPDPTNSTIAKAQQTANKAYGRISSVIPFTLKDADNQIILTFAQNQSSDTYFAIVSIVGITGTPPQGALVLTGMVRATDKLTITFAAAPGAGNSMSAEVLLISN